jgi:hypothetical protein
MEPVQSISMSMSTPLCRTCRRRRALDRRCERSALACSCAEGRAVVRGSTAEWQADNGLRCMVGLLGMLLPVTLRGRVKPPKQQPCDPASRERMRLRWTGPHAGFGAGQ